MRGRITWFFICSIALLLTACSSQIRYMLAEYATTDEYHEQQTEYIFTTVMRIHEDMPEFTFHRVVGDYVPEPWYEIPQPMEVGIVIEDAGISANQDTRQIEVFHREGAGHFFTFYEYHYGEFVRVPNTALLEELFIRWDDGTTQIGSRVENNKRVLYAVENYGLYITQLAVFPSWRVENGHSETEWCRPQDIFHLDVVDDWIILSVGEIQGTMNNFFGDLHRVRRDGSGREVLLPNDFSMNSQFTIIDGWVYHNVWNAQSYYGWIRIRPDGTDREFVGNTIYTIITFGEDGYIYGSHVASGWGNLARWQPESNESTTLFLRETVPTFEEYESILVSYGNITIADEHVYFTVTVTGAWRYAELIGWRTPWETLYSADYRVDKNGHNLTRVADDQKACASFDGSY